MSVYSHKQLADLGARFETGVSRPFNWRRKQLQGIYDLVHEKSTSLLDAALKGSNLTRADLLIEFNAVLDFVKGQLDSVIQQAETTSHKSPVYEARNPAGIVLVVPDPDFPFSSTLVPMAMAYAAGNVVALVASGNSIIADTMRSFFSTHLDQMGFTMLDAHSQSTDSAVGDALASPSVSVLDVRNANSISVTGTVKPFLSPSAVYVNFSAIGDRHDVPRSPKRMKAAQNIARLVVNGNLLFGGRSPCAPRVAFVDEDVYEEFSDALVDVIAELGVGTRMDFAAKDAKGIKTLVSGALNVLEVNSGRGAIESALPADGMPTLLLSKVASPETAIDRIQALDRLPTSYIFSRDPFTSYITTHIDSDFSIVNDIPIDHVANPYAACTATLRNMLSHVQRITRQPAPVSPVIPSERELALRLEKANIVRLDEGSGISTDFFGHVIMVFKAVKYTTYAGLAVTGWMLYNRYAK